jgi:16S rRNA (uracil1498-N3)-methyltransferase
MPVERFFKDSPLKKGETILLENEELHHLSHVLRLKKGAKLEVINGKGALAIGEIQEVGRNEAFITVEEVTIKSPPTYELILAQGMPRASRLEYILEKCVELGVTSIWLFPAAFSEKKTFSPSQMKRFHYIITSALKQSGRLYLPELILAPPIASWKNLPENSFFGDTDPQAPPLIQQVEKGKKTLIAIGPEKGFQDKEMHLMQKADIKGVSLHENILRTDTAAIASIAIASALL